jgi:hypothetical protein
LGFKRVLRRLMPGLLLALPATTALQGDLAIVQAAEECRAKPGPAAPGGGRWYYRIDRGDHRRCWFLASGDAGERSRLRRTRLATRREFRTDNSDGVRQTQQGPTEPQIALAPAEPAPAAPTAARPTLLQVVAPSLDPASQPLVPHTVPTISYRRPSATVQTPSGLLADTRRTDEESAAVASDAKSRLLVGAAATGLLFAGGILHYIGRRVRHRPHRRSDAQRVTVHRAVPIVRSPSLTTKLPITPIDLAPGLEKKPRANLAILKGLKGAHAG